MSTSGISADTNADGVVVNIIPKEGGNSFKTIFAGLFSNNSLEGDNIDDALKKRGLNAASKTQKLFDESASVGGPIRKDRLWFFGTVRTWGFARQNAGVFWNQTQDVFLTPPGAPAKVVKWTPYVDRPLDRLSGRQEWYDSVLGRITWQASKANKFAVTYNEQRGCNCGSVSTAESQEHYLSSYRFYPNRLVQGTWNSTLTSRLLLEAGFAATISQWNMYYNPGVNNGIVSISDVGLGISYGAPIVYLGHPNGRDRYTQRASLSYVTGSHNFKAGFQTDEANTNTYWQANQNVAYYFFNTIPIGILQWATPYQTNSRVKADMGIYGQDQWKLTNNVTLNLGLRWDYFNSYVPAQTAGFDGETDGYFQNPPVNPWLGQRKYDPVYDAPSWKDIDPRLGVAYNLLGNGRTALKFTAGRYVAKLGTDDIAGNIASQISRSVTNSFRGWGDANGNYVPDCDLGNFAANGECGAITNQFFGKTNPNAIVWSDAIRKGWGVRDYNWDMSTEIQHELRKGLSLTGGYYRNTGGYYRNQNSKNRVTDNILVTPSDFNQYCVTAPLDPRLPGGGGYPICGMSDINPLKFGQVQQVVKPTSQFGKNIRYNDFLSVGLDARMARGARLG